MIQSTNQSINTINKTESINHALRLLNDLPDKASRTLFVLDDNQKLVGTLTDGDIRRGLLNNLSLDDSILKAMNHSFKYILLNEDYINNLQKYRDQDIELLPIIDENFQLLKVVDLDKFYSYLPISAVIMAGGRGQRLRPLTDTVPKPMLHVGSKPIIEHNIDRLINFGISDISISIKYLGNLIQDYFKDGSHKNVNISYILEDEPLGTLGALKNKEEYAHDHILVMNSDLLTNINFEDFYKTFLDKKAEMCVATIPYDVKVPFAVLETKEELITSLREKPILTYQCNAGIYFLKKELLNEIPKGQFYNATDLIESLITQGKKVAYHPILSYWLDIGSKDDFLKAQKEIEHIKL